MMVPPPAVSLSGERERNAVFMINGFVKLMPIRLMMNEDFISGERSLPVPSAPPLVFAKPLSASKPDRNFPLFLRVIALGLLTARSRLRGENAL